MKVTNETGRSAQLVFCRNVFGYISLYGAKYNPGNPKLSVANFETSLLAAETAMSSFSTKLTLRRTLITERANLFDQLDGCIYRVKQTMKICRMDVAVREDVNLLANNLKYTPSKMPIKLASETDSSASVPPAPTRRANISFNKKLVFFEGLVTLLDGQSTYMSNEPNLSLAGLKSYLANLHSAHEAVMNNEIAIDLARIDLNEKLFKSNEGVVELAILIKEYVRIIFGKKSAEAQALVALPLKNKILK